MDRITNEQREAIVREAVAKRDAILADASASPESAQRLSALKRLHNAVGLYLGITNQTKHLKGFAYSEEVRKEIFAAYRAAGAALSSTEGSK